MRMLLVIEEEGPPPSATTYELVDVRTAEVRYRRGWRQDLLAEDFVIASSEPSTEETTLTVRFRIVREET